MAESRRRTPGQLPSHGTRKREKDGPAITSVSGTIVRAKRRRATLDLVLLLVHSCPTAQGRPRLLTNVATNDHAVNVPLLHPVGNRIRQNPEVSSDIRLRQIGRMRDRIERNFGRTCSSVCTSFLERAIASQKAAKPEAVQEHGRSHDGPPYAGLNPQSRNVPGSLRDPKYPPGYDAQE